MRRSPPGPELAAALERVKAAVEGVGRGEEEEIYIRLAEGLLAHGAGTGDLLDSQRRAEPSEGESAESRRAALLAWALAGLPPPDLAVTSEIGPSRLPLVGPLLDLARVPFHRLSLFYVHRLGARQAAYNQQVALILRALAAEIQRVDGEVARRDRLSGRGRG